MIKFLKILLTGILASFFFFPITFSFLPAVNTKNLMAVFGLVLVIWYMIREKDSSIPLEFIILMLFSGTVSLVSLLSITINQTPDTSYVSFIRATIIWLSSAFVVACAIRGTHNRIDVPLVVHYLLGVCLFQCAAAMMIEYIPAVKLFVDRYVIQGQEMLQQMNRLYGIGASLDVAGSRFAAVLTAIAFMLIQSPKKVSQGLYVFYIVSFLLIAIIGNMVARTTLVGVVIGMVLIFLVFLFRPSLPEEGNKLPQIMIWVVILLIGIAVSVYLYRTDPHTRKLFRFAFEGFFSMAEKGYWEVSSNETLKSMVVFPETLHTWIIGDGYFMNSRYDDNYLGDATRGGFYMGTDVGYLRFIFYFGVVGLIPIIGIMVYSTIVCMRYFKQEQVLFLLALLVNMVVWLKVSTDIFLYFALFLCAAALQGKKDKPAVPE